MKKSQLKSIIRECIQEVLTERLSEPSMVLSQLEEWAKRNPKVLKNAKYNSIESFVDDLSKISQMPQAGIENWFSIEDAIKKLMIISLKVNPKLHTVLSAFNSRQFVTR